MGGIRRDVRYDESDKNGPTIQQFLIVELAAPIVELPDRGLGHDAVVAVGKIEAPLIRLRIVETQAQTFEVTGWAIGLELQQIGAAIPDLADDRRAFHVDPGRRAGQGMQAALYVCFPGADLEIEIMLAVARPGGFLWRGFRSACSCLCQAGSG